MPSPSKGESHIVDDQGENTDAEREPGTSVTKKNDSIVAVPCAGHLSMLSIEFEKERTVSMGYVLRLHCCFDFGPTRVLAWSAGYCGIGPRTMYLDDKLRGNHGKDSRTYGASTCKSP